MQLYLNSFLLISFTMEKYRAIVKYKTSYYTFYLPIALAAKIVGMKDIQLTALESFAHQLGYFFQVQDDYLDAFGSEKITGKIGTDIQNGKCTWSFLCAKEKCSMGQLELLLENYGQCDISKVAIVEAIYDDLLVGNECIRHMQDVHKNIMQCIENLNKNVDFGIATFMRQLLEVVVSVPEVAGNWC